MCARGVCGCARVWCVCVWAWVHGCVRACAWYVGVCGVAMWCMCGVVYDVWCVCGVAMWCMCGVVYDVWCVVCVLKK